jgi:HSP20 family protein
MRYGLSRLMNEGLGNPLASLRRMEQELENLFGSYASGDTAFPPVNLQKNDTEVKVTAELPGYDPKLIELAVDGQVLTLTGRREEDQETKDGDWLVRERRTGAFRRAIALPWAVDQDKVAADYKNGVLTVVLPRSEAEKPRKIEVKTEA